MAVAGQLLVLLVCAITALAQQRTISARAGTINFQRGNVYLDGERVHAGYRDAHPLQMKNGQQLRLENGRVELLLGLGVYLRMLGISSLRMEETHLDDSRLLIEAGSVVIEVAGMTNGAQLRVNCGEAVTELRHDGSYRFDAPLPGMPGTLRIYNGDTSVSRDGRLLKFKAGMKIDLGGELRASKFDVNESDALMAWASQRTHRRITAERRVAETRAMQAAKRKAQADAP